MIKLGKAIVLITCLGAILAVAMPASASQAMHRHSIFRIASHATAAPGAQLWASRYSGSVNGQDEPFSVAVSPDGATVYVTGISTGSSSGFDYATVAYSAATGAQLWANLYNSPANSGDSAISVAVSPDGRKVVVTGTSAGIYYPDSNKGEDYATVAYNATTGTQLWVKRYNGPAKDYDGARSVTVNPASSVVYVTGISTGINTGSDYATIAYNAATGVPRWTSLYNGPANGDDVATSMAVSPATGTVYVTGQSDGTNTGPDYATVAYQG